MKREQRLTKRQMELLILFSMGMTADRVAQELNISKRTVEGHTYRLRLLFGSATTPQLVATAKRRKIII